MSETAGAPAADEEPLVGDGVTTGIVRIGDTVRRPVRPFTRTVHALLQHLHDAGFDAAPRPLGFDDQGREMLTFLAGDVPREPLPDYATRDEVLVALARLIRREHPAAHGWQPPAYASWGGLPGVAPHGLLRLFDEPELVAHMDYCPGNVVFRDGLPAALIDFDLAQPTTRLNDVANALYWWAPLLHPADRAPALVDADIPTRVALFADAYGLDAAQRAELMPLAVRRVHNNHLTFRAAADADPAFRRMWENGVRERMPRTQAWTIAVAGNITRRLTGEP